MGNVKLTHHPHFDKVKWHPISLTEGDVVREGPPKVNVSSVIPKPSFLSSCRLVVSHGGDSEKNRNGGYPFWGVHTFDETSPKMGSHGGTGSQHTPHSQPAPSLDEFMYSMEVYNVGIYTTLIYDTWTHFASKMGGRKLKMRSF